MYQKDESMSNLKYNKISLLPKFQFWVSFGFQCRRDTIVTKLCEKNIIIQLLIKSNRILTL